MADSARAPGQPPAASTPPTLSAPLTPSASVPRVFDLFTEAAARTPTATAYADRSGVTLTYRELYHLTISLAALIKEQHHDRQS